MKLLHRSQILWAAVTATCCCGSGLQLEHLLDLRLDGRTSLVEALLAFQLPELLDLSITAAHDMGPGGGHYKNGGQLSRSFKHLDIA